MNKFNNPTLTSFSVTKVSLKNEILNFFLVKNKVWDGMRRFTWRHKLGWENLKKLTSHPLWYGNHPLKTAECT